MTDQTDMPDLGALTRELQRLEIPLHYSECHGNLCGMLCADPGLDFRRWIARLARDARDAVDPERGLNVADPERELPGLAALFRATAAQLDDAEFGFHLLLADEDADLAQRSESVAAWCRGFMFGLSAGGVTDLPQLSEDVNEVLRDMLQISRLSGEDVTESEEDEAAFAEIEEYLRVGVLLTWTELKRRARTSPQESTLH